MIRTGAGPATGVLRPERSPSGAVSVLIIVADGVLAGPLATAFDAAGALTIVARDPATARIRFNADRPDVVVLDLQLGAWSGFDILRELRAAGDVPIVVLTARDSDDDRTRALGMGADDYVSKPFDDRELVARALGRLRQPGAVTAPAMVPHIVAGGLELDATTHTVTRDGRPLNLTVTEFKLLHHLMANAGRVVETGSLLRDVWEQGDRKDPDVLRVTLHRLRKKLGEPAHSEIIQTVPGVGILFKTAADATLTKSEPWSPEPRQPVPERVAIGPIEFADRDRLRLRGVSDPQLESLLFAIPAAALEAFESDRFASTWIVPFAAAGTFDAIEAARSAGHAVAADVSERLAGSRPKVVVTRRQYGATLVGSPSPATRPEDALAPTAADAILESPVRPAAVAQLPAAMPTSAVTPTPAPRAASQPATAQAPAAVPVMATPAASAMETAPSADRVRGRETPLPTVAVAARALAAATSARAAGAVRGGSTRAAGLAAGLRTSTQLGRSRVRLPSRPLPLRQSPAAVPTDIPAKAREQHADTAAPSHRRLSTPARSIAVLLFVCMAVALLSVAFQLSDIGLFVRGAAGEPVTAGELAVAESRQVSVAVALLSAYGATLITFLAWFHAVYARARAANGRPLRYPWGWTVASFFVPLANVIVPYQVLTQIARRGTASGSSAGSPPRAIIDLWWAAWIAFLLANLATAFTPERPTFHQLATGARLNIVADLLGIVAAALAVVVVVALDRSLPATAGARTADPVARVARVEG